MNRHDIVETLENICNDLAWDTQIETQIASDLFHLVLKLKRYWHID